MNAIDRYITIEEAMKIMGIRSRTTFDRLCRDLKIDKYKFRRSVRVRLNQIQDRLEGARSA